MGNVTSTSQDWFLAEKKEEKKENLIRLSVFEKDILEAFPIVTSYTLQDPFIETYVNIIRETEKIDYNVEISLWSLTLFAMNNNPSFENTLLCDKKIKEILNTTGNAYDFLNAPTYDIVRNLESCGQTILFNNGNMKILNKLLQACMNIIWKEEDIFNFISNAVEKKIKHDNKIWNCIAKIMPSYDAKKSLFQDIEKLQKLEIWSIPDKILNKFKSPSDDMDSNEKYKNCKKCKKKTYITYT